MPNANPSPQNAVAVDALRLKEAELKIAVSEKKSQYLKLEEEIQQIQVQLEHILGAIEVLEDQTPSSEPVEQPVEEVEYQRSSPQQPPANTPSNCIPFPEQRRPVNLPTYQPPQRKPMEMLKDKFKQNEQKLGDIVAQVLADLGRPADAEELTKLLYDAQSVEEFRRARNSLSSELRDGIKRENPQWCKLDRSNYAPFGWQATGSSLETLSAPSNIFDGSSKQFNDHLATYR